MQPPVARDAETCSYGGSADAWPASAAANTIVESSHARLQHATSRPIRDLASENLQHPVHQNRLRHTSQHLFQMIQWLQLPLEDCPQLQNGGRPLVRVQ